MLAADLDCRRHKRSTEAARAWEVDREANLYALYHDLVDGNYSPGPSICFAIARPKPREVFAAGYRDRVDQARADRAKAPGGFKGSGGY